MVTIPAAEPLTWDTMRAVIERFLQQPPPPARHLRCGTAVWAILSSGADETADHFGGAGALYGTPVLVDTGMPDGAWQVLEGDRIVDAGDYAPGFRRAMLVPGLGLVAFADDLLADVETLDSGPRRVTGRWLLGTETADDG